MFQVLTNVLILLGILDVLLVLTIATGVALGRFQISIERENHP